MGFLRGKVMLHGEAEMLLEACKRFPDHSFRREKDVIGVEPVRIHVHMGIYPGLLQMPDIVQRLAVKGLNIPDIRVARRQSAVILAAGRSRINRDKISPVGTAQVALPGLPGAFCIPVRGVVIL